MCYSCSPFCENCHCKWVTCPHCGRKNLVQNKKCCGCGRPISEEARTAARELWAATHTAASTKKEDEL